MKRTCQTILALCLPLLLCGQVQAQHTGPYVGAFLGGSVLTSAKSSDNLGDFGLSFKPALQESAVLGWDFEPGNPLGEGRMELEYTRRSNTLDKAKYTDGSVPGGGNVTADSLLVNFFAVVHDGGRWSPYVGVGVGAARLQASDLTVTGQPLGSGSDVTIAYQLGAGIDVMLTERLNLDIGYRFFNTSSPAFTEANAQKFKIGYATHSAVLGLRVGF